MEREYKRVTAEIKELNEKGEGLIKFASLNVIDLDEDVTRPGAFGNQIMQMVPAHEWKQSPIGKAQIHEEGDDVLAHIRLNLNNSHGKDWYESIKFDMEVFPPPKQEYSYGYSVLKESRGEFENRNVRFLERLDVHELSPVLKGAGIGTTTLALKEGKQSKLEEDIALVREHIEKLIARVKGIKELREKDGRSISKERVKELIDIEGLLVELKHLCESPKDEQGGVITEFHEIEKRMIDFRKSLL